MPIELVSNGRETGESWHSGRHSGRQTALMLLNGQKWSRRTEVADGSSEAAETAESMAFPALERKTAYRQNRRK